MPSSVLGQLRLLFERYNLGWNLRMGNRGAGGILRVGECIVVLTEKGRLMFMAIVLRHI